MIVRLWPNTGDGEVEVIEFLVPHGDESIALGNAGQVKYGEFTYTFGSVTGGKVNFHRINFEPFELKEEWKL